MSEKRSKKSRKTEPAVRTDREPSRSRADREGSGRKPADYGTTVKLLYGIAIVLAIAACAIIGVKTAEDLRAEQSASTLLNAYKEMATADPAETLLTTATPEATATLELASAPVLPTPGPTPDVNLDEVVAEHRVDAANETNVDELGAYVQPDDATLAETQEIIEKVVNAIGDDGVIGTIEIPKYKQEYPIIGKWSYALLKISICRYLGGDPNQSGKNLVLIGHNYKSGAHFGNLKRLEVGDEIYLTAKNGARTRYVIYDTEAIEPDDFEALDKYRGDAGLTLLTCRNNGTGRLVVRCEQKPIETSVSTGTAGAAAAQ